MSISATSSTADVMTKYNTWAPSTTDLTAWKTLTPVTSDTDTVMKVGVFGVDLADFLADCVTAQGTTKCVSKDYDNFNGWAVGISWTTTSTSTAVRGVCFSDTKICAELTFAGTNTFNAYPSTVAVAAAHPTDSEDGTALAEDNPFTGW